LRNWGNYDIEEREKGRIWNLLGKWEKNVGGSFLPTGLARQRPYTRNPRCGRGNRPGKDEVRRNAAVIGGKGRERGPEERGVGKGREGGGRKTTVVEGNGDNCEGREGRGKGGRGDRRKGKGEGGQGRGTEAAKEGGKEDGRCKGGKGRRKKERKGNGGKGERGREVKEGDKGGRKRRKGIRGRGGCMRVFGVY